MTQSINLGLTDATMTVLSFDEDETKKPEQTTDVCNTVVQNMDYEPEGFLTVYGTTNKDGVLHYIVLSKSVIEAIQRIKL